MDAAQASRTFFAIKAPSAMSTTSRRSFFTFNLR
jgi:hypothetical protein